MPPRRPGVSTKQADHLDPLANLPDFVDPDEAIVSSWSEADRAGHRLETSSSLGLPRFKDYTSQDATEGSVTWLAEVASQPQRSDRLGVGATPAKVADQPAKELQPLGKAARKAMNRRRVDCTS
eukprot:symbB.v1.2.031602.t1/scaffold3687.1/size52011/3